MPDDSPFTGPNAAALEAIRGGRPAFTGPYAAALTAVSEGRAAPDADPRAVAAKDAYADVQEGPGLFALRRMVPVTSTLLDAADTMSAAHAQRRIEAGSPADGDFERVAHSRRLQEIDRNRTTPEAVVSAVAHVPAIVGEAVVGGGIAARGALSLAGRLGLPAAEAVPTLLGKEGIKQALTREGAKAYLRASPEFAVRTAGATAGMPSMYLPDAAQRAAQGGGEVYSGKNIGPAFLLGAAQTAVLGQLARAADAPSRGVLPWATTVAGRTGLGVAEQTAVDVLAGASGLKTGYGPVSDWLAGKEDGPKGTAALVATFAVFAALHQRPTPDAPANLAAGREIVKAAADAADTYAKSGKPRSAFEREMDRRNETFMKLLADDPATAFDRARELVKEEKDAAFKDYAAKIAATIPPPERPAPPTGQPTQPAPAASRMIDIRQAVNDHGGDAAPALAAVRAEIKAHLDAGGTAALWADGKRIDVARVKNEFVYDNKGNPWGLLGLAMNRPGTRSGVELFPPSPEIRTAPGAEKTPAELIPRSGTPVNPGRPNEVAENTRPELIPQRAASQFAGVPDQTLRDALEFAGVKRIPADRKGLEQAVAQNAGVAATVKLIQKQPEIEQSRNKPPQTAVRPEPVQPPPEPAIARPERSSQESGPDGPGLVQAFEAEAKKNGRIPKAEAVENFARNLLDGGRIKSLGDFDRVVATEGYMRGQPAKLALVREATRRLLAGEEPGVIARMRTAPAPAPSPEIRGGDRPPPLGGRQVIDTRPYEPGSPPADFQGRGWKLHLASDDPEAVSRVLVELGVPHKVGRSGQAGKDLTVYVGSRATADRLAKEIERRAGKFLKVPRGPEVENDDIPFTPSGKVVGRFDADDPRGGFHQYGAKGVPFLEADMDPWNKSGTPGERWSRADAALRKRYGDFYTGAPEARPAPGGDVFERADHPGQDPARIAPRLAAILRGKDGTPEGNPLAAALHNSGFDPETGERAGGEAGTDGTLYEQRVKLARRLADAHDSAARAGNAPGAALVEQALDAMGVRRTAAGGWELPDGIHGKPVDVTDHRPPAGRIDAATKDVNEFIASAEPMDAQRARFQEFAEKNVGRQKAGDHPLVTTPEEAREVEQEARSAGVDVARVERAVGQAEKESDAAVAHIQAGEAPPALPPRGARESEFNYQNRIRRAAGAKLLLDVIQDHGGIDPKTVEDAKGWAENFGTAALRNKSGRRGSQPLDSLYQELQNAGFIPETPKSMNAADHLRQLLEASHIVQKGDRWFMEEEWRNGWKEEQDRRAFAEEQRAKAGAEPPMRDPFYAGRQRTIDGREVPVPRPAPRAVKQSLIPAEVERTKAVEDDFNAMKAAANPEKPSPEFREADERPVDPDDPTQPLDGSFDFGLHDPGPTDMQVGGVPGTPGGITLGAPKTYAHARANVTEERADRGREAVVKGAKVADPAAWAEAERRLRADPNLAARLVNELEADPGKATDSDIPVLLLRRLNLAQAYDSAARRYALERQAAELRGQSPDAADKRRLDELAAERDRLDKVVDRVGAKAGRQLRYYRLLAREDYTLAGLTGRARAAAGRDLTGDEVTKLAGLADAVKEADRALDAAEKRGDKPTGEVGDITDLKVKARQARRKADELLARLDFHAKPLPAKAVAAAREAIGVHRAFLTAFDLSHLFNQGGLPLLGRPVESVKAGAESLKFLFSERGYQRAMQQLRDRPQFPEYERAELFFGDVDAPLNAREEVLGSAIANRIPGVRPFARAYTGGLNLLRAEIYDAVTGGVRPETTAEAKAIGHSVNAYTGRGTLGQAEKAADVLGTVLFSPRFLASRVQIAIGQPLWAAPTPAVLAIAAREYARVAAGAAVVLGTAALAGGTVEHDPRSADFMKMRFGRLRIDPLAGLAQVLVFATRFAWGETKKQDGRIVPLRGAGANPHREGVGDVVLRFLRSKAAPIPGALYDRLVAGTTPDFREATAGNLGFQLGVPMSAQELVRGIWDGMEKSGTPRVSAAAIISALGVRAQEYEYRPAR